jgi:hypothetical protein
MEPMPAFHSAYAIPHFAIHQGERHSVPIDVASLFEEVIREHPIQFPRMRLPLRQEEENAFGREPAHDISEQASGFTQPVTKEIRPSAASQPDAEAAAAHRDADSFRKNRAQLFHPPPERRRSPLQLVAYALTLFIMVIALYVLYVGGALNSILPSSLQYQRPSLDQQLQRSVTMLDTKRGGQLRRV